MTRFSSVCCESADTLIAHQSGAVTSRAKAGRSVRVISTRAGASIEASPRRIAIEVAQGV